MDYDDADVADLARGLKDAADRVNGGLTDVKARLLEIEKKMVRDGGGYEFSDNGRTLGKQVAESEQFKGWLSNGARGSVKIQLKDVTTAAGSAGALIPIDHRAGEAVTLPRQRLTIRGLLAQGRTNSGLVSYPRQTGFTNNAGVVSEGTLKPESEIAYEDMEAPVRTIAHWIHVSRQAMDDAPALSSLIDSDLRYGLALAEEEEILNGDGTGQHLDGLIANAAAFSPPFVISGPTMLDTILLAIAQSELAKIPATGIVLNDMDWRQMQSIKDSEGRYIGGGPFSQTPPTLWNLPVVATPAMAQDDFLVGNFNMAAQIFDRMDVEVLISSEDRSNFVENKLTVRAEQRLALAIKRPDALWRLRQRERLISQMVSGFSPSAHPSDGRLLATGRRNSKGNWHGKADQPTAPSWHSA
jgi:HK97 family phage major capsid protein